MTEFDTVIRRGTVVTASDTFEAEVGISDGKIQAIARNLPPGRKTIDAQGKLVTPGGVDATATSTNPPATARCARMTSTPAAGVEALRRTSSHSLLHLHHA